MRNRPTSSLELRRRRRGSLTTFLVAALTVMLGVLALAIDWAYVSMAHAELSRAADAAALAGAQALVDDDDLRAPSQPGARQRRADRAARQFARFNATLADPTELVSSNDPHQRDIRIGRLIYTAPGRCTFDDDFPGSPNTVQVIARRTASRNNPVALLLGSFLGTASADVVAAAQATLDDEIIGFKPICGVPVPLVPLAIRLGDSACSRNDTWESAITMRRGGDWFGFDKGTCRIVRRTDGIPELELVFNDSRSGAGVEPNAALVRIGHRFDPATIARQIRDGVDEGDLESRGGSIQLRDGSSLALEAQFALPGGLVSPCSAILGQTRIWPVFRGHEDSQRGTRARVTVVGFVGARVVDVSRREHGCVVIRIQPCFVVTRSAIAEPGRGHQRNVYIRKISITG